MSVAFEKKRELWKRIFTLKNVKKIVFGIRAVDKLGVEAKQLGSRKAFIVTDKGIVKASLVDGVRDSLEKERFEVKIFDEVETEPHIEAYDMITEAVREDKYDLIVGVGGGSSLDMAKVAAVMRTNPGKVSRYVGVNLVQKAGLSKILIPTTAGTGSEVTDWSILTVGETKKGISSPYLCADVVIVDPIMTLSMPPKVTAATGIDALSHAIEAYISKDSSPVTDMFALEATKLIMRNLRTAYFHGKNIKARYHLSLAATMAGMAFSNAGLVIGHSASYSYAIRFKLPHGVACGIALPSALNYNLPACIDKLALIGEAICEKTIGLSKREIAFKTVVAVEKLMEDINMPTKLRDVGDVPKELINIMADELLARPPDNLRRNPRRLTRADAIKLFERIASGEIQEKTSKSIN